MTTTSLSDKKTLGRKGWLFLSVLASGLVGVLLLWPDSSDGLSESWSWFETLDRLHLDKVGHMTLNFALALVYWASLLKFRVGTKVSPWLAAGLAFGYSGLIEVLQQAVPGRMSTMSDVVANTAGVLLFVGLVSLGVFRGFSR